MSNYQDRRLTLDVPQVAALLGVGENQLYAACKAGASPIPCYRVGRRVVFARAVVEHTPAQASPQPRWRCPARKRSRRF